MNTFDTYSSSDASSSANTGGWSLSNIMNTFSNDISNFENNPLNFIQDTAGSTINAVLQNVPPFSFAYSVFKADQQNLQQNCKGGSYVPIGNGSFQCQPPANNSNEFNPNGFFGNFFSTGLPKIMPYIIIGVVLIAIIGIAVFFGPDIVGGILVKKEEGKAEGKIQNKVQREVQQKLNK